MSAKKLFLLDGMALIYRAYFAFSSNPRISSKGLNTSAIFGFTNTVLEILNKEKPTHIAVVFDTPEDTIRHTEFVVYKSQREEMPDDLRKEFEEEYNLDPDYIKNNLYKEPNPNAYLATFAKFLIKHKDTDFCKKFITMELEDFIENYIKQFDNYQSVPVHFVGSIAFYLREELQEILTQHGIQLGNVLRRPIDGLIAYHIMNN
jgi:8-oxo-dGTP pyrophosphatase MutT (NUDIX family)